MEERSAVYPLPGAPGQHSFKHIVLANEVMPKGRYCMQPGESEIGAKLVQFLDEPRSRTIRQEGCRDREQAEKLSASPRNHVRSIPRTGMAISSAYSRRCATFASHLSSSVISEGNSGAPNTSRKPIRIMTSAKSSSPNDMWNHQTRSRFGSPRGKRSSA